MSKKEDGLHFVVGAIAGLVVGAIGGIITLNDSNVAISDGWKQQAIEHGCAGYNAKTGKFQWNMEKMK